MSSFDDEFGLFGDESGEGERQPILGARKIASKETVLNDVEPEDAGPSRGRSGGGRSGGGSRYGGGGGGRSGGFAQRRESRPPSDPVASARRASSVLEFVAKRLVTKPDDVAVELFADEDGKPVIELIVDPEDLGKVIGRNGRVAQALRTIVRATAEGRISVDILDTEEAAESDVDGDEEEGDA
jgi:predicted RNA-binding protein YlqC (UPF0109 family)